MSTADEEPIADIKLPFGVALGFLAAGAAFADLPCRISGQSPCPGGPVTIAELRSAMFATARLVERRPLSPPSTPAFVHYVQSRMGQRGHDPLAGVDMATLPSRTVDVLDRLALPPTPVEAKPPAGLQLAACYANMVLAEYHYRRAWRLRGRGDFLRREVTNEDDARLEEYFLQYQFGPGHMFSAWVRLVERLESTGRFGMDADYTNELDSRDILEGAITLVAPPAAASIRREVEPWDERFYTATRLASGDPLHLLGRSPWRPRAWWWYRVPEHGF